MQYRKHPVFDPTIPTALITETSKLTFVILLIFWFIGFIIPIIFPPISFTDKSAYGMNPKPVDEEDLFEFDRHLTVDEIYDHLFQLEVFFKGRLKLDYLPIETVEGKKILVAYISQGPHQKGNKRVVVVVGNMAAQIWDSGMAAIQLVYDLCAECRARRFLTHYDWFIIPVLNPDGFTFSISMRDENLAEASSPKNRRSINDCFGVNIGRNFPFHWGEGDSRDYSDPCRSQYSGSEPASENETIALMDFLKYLQYNGRVIDVVFSLDGNYFLNDLTFPWEFTTATVKHYEILDFVVKKAANITSVITDDKFHGSQAGLRECNVDKTGVCNGSIIETLGSGTLIDYVMGHHLVPFSFSLQASFYPSPTNESLDPGLYINNTMTALYSIMEIVNYIQTEQERYGYR